MSTYLMNDNGNDISKLIKSINVSYVLYFNRKYRRCDHFFQNRFLSEWVLDDNYLMQVSKYIHNNPVKAGMVKNRKIIYGAVFLPTWIIVNLI